MIKAQVKFGRKGKATKDELKNLAHSYLAALLKAGQTGGEYLLAWTNGVLNAHLLLAGPDAVKVEYHSPWGRRELDKLKEAFGNPPEWVLLDDDLPVQPVSWKGASSLFLMTHAFDDESPICHGDTGKGVPVNIFPISFEDKERLFSWQADYRAFDRIQLGCGKLEIPAYRQMAEPKSELSQAGRKLCSQIEAVTGVPTFYYLTRYWGRTRGEGDRRCPGCGHAWRVTATVDPQASFHHFEFRCHDCRMVSHIAPVTDGGRLARIGEYADAGGKRRR